MRPWSSRRQRLLSEHGQYGRPGVLNSTPGQSPDRPGLTERVRLKSPEGYGGYRAEIQARADTLRTSVFRFDDAGATTRLETSPRRRRRGEIGALGPPGGVRWRAQSFRGIRPARWLQSLAAGSAPA